MFQALGDIAAKIVDRLESRALVGIDGKFDTQAIAERVAARWAGRQDFLSQFEGALLSQWQNRLWDETVDKVWKEASFAQTRWFFANIKTIYTPEERVEWNAFDVRQRRLPIYEHHEFRELTWAKQHVDDEARKRSWDEAAVARGIARDRDAAFADVFDHRVEIALAAE